MQLFVDATDLQYHQLGIIHEAQFLVLETIHESPEHLLGSIQTFVGKNGFAFSDIKSIYAVRGPGSSTAIRAMASVLNTFAFVLDTVLYAVTNEDGGSAENLLPILLGSPPVERILPFYGRDPNITAKLEV